MARISVIIPTYNGTTRFIEQGLESVLAQTYPDMELIVVDDASTDDTMAVVQRHLHSCQHQVEYIQRSVNGGPGAARNDGARLATGEYLAFFDQDDLWAPSFLAETAQVLRKTTKEVGAVHTDRWDINARGGIIKYVGCYRPCEPNFRHTQIARLLCRGNNVTLPAMLLKRAAFEAVGGFEEHLRSDEDREFHIRFHQRFTVLHIPEPLFSYRIRYGISAHRSQAPLDVRLACRLYLLRTHGPLCVTDALRQALQAEWALWYSDRGKFELLTQRNKVVARHYFTFSLKLRVSTKTLLRYLRSYLPLF